MSHDFARTTIRFARISLRARAAIERAGSVICDESCEPREGRLVRGLVGGQT